MDDYKIEINLRVSTEVFPPTAKDYSRKEPAESPDILQ